MRSTHLLICTIFIQDSIIFISDGQCTRVQNANLIVAGGAPDNPVTPLNLTGTAA